MEVTLPPGFQLPVKELVACMQPYDLAMSLLSIQDKQMTIDAVDYFLSELKTQAVKDEQRIQAYTQLLSWLRMDLSKYTM